MLQQGRCSLRRLLRVADEASNHSGDWRSEPTDLADLARFLPWKIFRVLEPWCWLTGQANGMFIDSWCT